MSSRTGTRAVHARTVDGRDSAELAVRTDRFVQQAVWRDDGLMLYREGFSDGATMRDIYPRLPGDTPSTGPSW